MDRAFVQELAGPALTGAPPSRVPPLLLGAWGPRGTALAGQIADELKVGGTASPAVIAQAQQRVTAASLAAGRVPGGVRVVAGAVPVVAEDGATARRRARGGRESRAPAHAPAARDRAPRAPAAAPRRARGRRAPHG